MENQQLIKKLLEGAKIAHHQRNYLLQYKKLHKAGEILENEENYEEAAKLFKAAAKVCGKLKKMEDGIKDGERACYCYLKAGLHLESIRLYDSMVKILEQNGWVEKAELLRRKRTRIMRKYGIEIKHGREFL